MSKKPEPESNTIIHIVFAVFVLFVTAAAALNEWPAYQQAIGTMFAGLAALSAAIIAYIGVTSKTRLDRQLADEKERYEWRNAHMYADRICFLITFYSIQLHGRLKNAKSAAHALSALNDNPVFPEERMERLWERLGQYDADLRYELSACTHFLDKLRRSYETAIPELIAQNFEEEPTPKGILPGIVYMGDKKPKVRSVAEILKPIKSDIKQAFRHAIVAQTLSQRRIGNEHALSSDERDEIIQTHPISAAMD
ncbi:hypothetical protein [Ferrovibrio sp.]|uniref:hypothetical protein n=1 Tax=Ferrovibrio sp. TaxID=1917215 RepID=UPI000CAB0CA3|nr:hypothetical protein [Ferrovibrio sp.]PJI40400.1 MAG: hypothetical protein CTR53_10340 [Ferrovibrio sp.]